MGGQNSKQTTGQSPVQIDHPKFQNAKVIEQKGKVFMNTSMGVEQNDYTKWKTIISGLKTDPEYLLLPKKHDFSTKGLCGSSGTLNASYQYYPYLLLEEIQNRKRRKSKFQQCQLWFLLYSLSAAQTEMKKYFNSKVGDIRPQNIFISQEGQIKVSCLKTFPNEGTNFQKSFDHQETLLAPQEMNKLELGGMDDIYNFQSEMFSIGITVLSAALLTDFSNVYDVKKFKFNYEVATNYIEQWKTNDTYSQIFTAFISNLCSFDATNRLNQRQLWSWINKYDRQIQEKEDFVIDHAPLKIQKQIQQNRNESSINMLNQGRHEHSFVNHGNIGFQQRSTVYPFIQGQRVVSPAIQTLPPHILANPYNVPVNPLLSFLQIPQGNIQTAQSMYTQIPPQVYQKQFGHIVQPARVSGYQGYQPSSYDNARQVGTHFVHNGANMVHNGTNVVHNGTNMVQNGGTFVYTRRIIDPNSNKVIVEETIDQGEYNQGLTGSDKEVDKLQ